MTDWIRSEAESDKYVAVGYRAVPPRRRDFWRVLLGRYRPEVVRTTRLTLAGMDRELKRVWSGPMQEALHRSSPLLERLDFPVDGPPEQ